jgi:hypothetical protein
VSNISVDVDERREATLIMMTQDAKIQDNCSHEFLCAPKVLCLLFVYVFGCVLFHCRFMVFEVCNSMEMSLLVGFGDGTGLLL